MSVIWYEHHRGVAAGYAYYWATKEMGADAVSRMASYNTVAVPAILN